MHIYLIRHAHAEDGTPDAGRPLSDKGRRQIRKVGRFLKEAGGLEAEEIWHSPLARARETAQGLHKSLRLKAKLSLKSGLRPDDDPQAIARRLRQVEYPVAVVGHDPSLSALASLLVAGRSLPLRFTLKKCAVLRLDRSGNGWVVRWQISPEII
jgi:phosphohistidine phosphatase